MKVERTGTAAFHATFESEAELQAEHRTNLALGALRLPTAESLPLHTTLLVTLTGPSGADVYVKATVVATLPDGLALAIDGDPEQRLTRLAAKTGERSDVREEEEPEEDVRKDEEPEKRENTWDRVRSLSQMEKILLAVKADRSERALLLQDNDPRVLLSLLRNPRLTVDEVARLAKSSFLTFQIAEVITKATQWMSSLDVRVGLIHNPKTPPAFAMRILPTLPDSEVRAVARGGTNMQLKQAALRRLQGKP
ncbi:MAG TPA: hypothetical protein VFP80_10260 [Thermoanaerobaculia bacterium]|nr:hypothetical protein [Thermoanaerobaculia bacterium]